MERGNMFDVDGRGQFFGDRESDGSAWAVTKSTRGEDRWGHGATHVPLSDEPTVRKRMEERGTVAGRARKGGGSGAGREQKQSERWGGMTRAGTGRGGCRHSHGRGDAEAGQEYTMGRGVRGTEWEDGDEGNKRGGRVVRRREEGPLQKQ